MNSLLIKSGGMHPIKTVSGGQFSPLAPKLEDVCLADIAHALALTVRFGGHMRTFYSVAEHSVRVSEICDPADALWGLLHDASEAYLGDMPRPIKQHWDMRYYRQWHADAQRVIEARFGLHDGKYHVPLPESVRIADEVLLATEARDLLGRTEFNRLSEIRDISPLPEDLQPWGWEEARDRFLDRFQELGGTPCAR